MTTDIATWLAERERLAQEELEHYEREAQKRRGALELVRQWRREVAQATEGAPVAALTPGDSNSHGGRISLFTETNDPTGKRRMIWSFLNEVRPRGVSNKGLVKALIRRGEMPSDSETSDVSVTTSRMAKAGQIEKVGRGRYRLPPLEDSKE